MAQFEKWFTQDLTQNIELRHCESIVFTNDNNSNVVGVNLFVNGVEYSGGGTVTASVVRSDGATVALSGTLDGNKASVTLTSGCFGAPGLIGVYIRLNDGDTKTTVLSAVFTVIQSETDSAVDPGTIIPSVQVLIDDINDAVGSIPPDYSALLATIAPNFSASTEYSAGQYIWNSGTLYRFTVDHAAGAWTGTDAAAAVIGDDLSKTVTVDENSPDWLYEMIFGDTSDWTADQTGTYAGASCTKHGRRFDFVGMGSAAGSTVIWYNLTGTTHRAFNASVTNTTPASVAQDSDYIDIPVKLSNVAGNANRYEIVGCDLLASFTRTSTSASANQVRLVFGFRRLNTETGEYEYTDSHSLGTSADYRYGGAVRGYIATSQLYDQTSYNAYWTEYEQVAIYLVRYSQRISGSVILTPVMERFPADEGVQTLYADTPVAYWGSDGSSVLSGRTLQRVNGHDYTLSGTASGSLYYKLDGTIGVVSTTSGASGWEGTIDLEENVRYSLTVIPLSGAFTGTEGFYVALRTPDNTNVCTVNMLSGKQRSVSFVWSDSTEKGKLILRVQQNIVTDTSFTFRVLITKHISEDGCVDVSGTTPNIVAVPGAAYFCVGTGSYVSPVAVTELSFVPSERGVCSVRFVSGTTPTVLTLPNTVKMPDWWTGTEANRTYEISIADGQFGVVTSWT